MPVSLLRRALPDEVDPHDEAGLRDFVCRRVRDAIKATGRPRDLLLLFTSEHEEVLDLGAARADRPDAHAGATLATLAARPDVVRAMALFHTVGGDPERGDRHFAVLFEPGDEAWWCGTLEYGVDPESGVGVPATWLTREGARSDAERLWPFLREVLQPPDDAQVARVLPARPATPDVSVAIGELPEGIEPPSDAREQVLLAVRLVADDLLARRIAGLIAVRTAERTWEVWVFRGELPASPTELLRYVANSWQPAADGIAVAQLAIRHEDEPPRPALQVIGERDGMVCEAWAELAPPKEPGGPQRFGEVLWRGPGPVPEEGLWLGVPTDTELPIAPPDWGAEA